MILASIYFVLLLGIPFLFFVDFKNKTFVKFFSLIISGSVLILSSILFIDFNFSNSVYQQELLINVNFFVVNISLNFAIDGLSLLFFSLSSLLVFLCLIFILNDNSYKYYSILLLIIELFLLIIFSILDLVVFYMFFEAILIPMFLIIGIWGSRERKIRALYLFFFYTLCGSILLLIGIFYIYVYVGTCNMEYLSYIKISLNEQKILWAAFFLSFASKIPVFPLHIWLPEAHVEAPTVGSVLLAGILLKLGVYGFLRYSLVLFPYASLYFSPLVYIFSIIGIISASFCAIRQTDLKRIIAYSSIAHMNLIVLGIFSFNLIGIEGSILQSISHGFVSGGLFFLIGILYDRYHSRFLQYYGGLVHFMPLYSSFFLIFTMANIALPGTSSFIGELMLLLGIFKFNSTAGTISCLGVIFCGAYSLWLCNKILFGNLKNIYTLKFLDLNLKEFLILLPLFVLIVVVGLNPNVVLSFSHMVCLNILFESF